MVFKRLPSDSITPMHFFNGTGGIAIDSAFDRGSVSLFRL